jgi:hypothetical protein
LKWVALLVVAAVAVCSGAGAHATLADACGVPSTTPVWVDFGGHAAPITAQPGETIAVASGTDVPAQIRAAGSATVLFDLNFNKRVGTTTSPADPSVIDSRAQSLFQYAVSVTGCSTPTIAENELSGAQTPTPWTPNNAQYRANVLQFLTDLSNMGATPLLSIPNPPYTASTDAAYWWQEVSKVAILLRQVYFTSPNAVGLYNLGTTAASRSMRQSLRGLVAHLTQIEIPSQRIALELQMTTSPGLGQRAGLEPDTSWYEIVKLEALAAKFVATQFKLAGIWSWGWATFNPNVTPDPSTAVAACVWLWTRNPSLCNAPSEAGAGFDTSLTEGQLDVPAADRCVTDAGEITRNQVAQFTAITGDPGYAASALLEELTLSAHYQVDYPDLLSAERAVIDAEFGGNRANYWAALKTAHVPLADARAIIAARLERDDVMATLRAPAASQATIADFLSTYANEQARLVTTTAKAPWLNGLAHGWAIETLAPDEVFALTGPGKIDTADGTFDVTPSGDSVPLGLLPHGEAIAAARQALSLFDREAEYRQWLRSEETALLSTASCLNDQAPAPEETDLSPFVPFLYPPG